MAAQRRTGDTVEIEGGYQHRALHNGNPVQRHWHMSKLRAIDHFLPALEDDVIADVGCGSGVVSHHLSKSCKQVIGIDGNEDAIHFANATYRSDNLQFVHGLVDEIHLKPESLSKIYCLEVVEHLYDNQVKELIQVFYRLLRPGGRLMLTTPNYRSLWPVIEQMLDLFKLVPKLQGEQHVTKFTKSKLARVCRDGGFRIVRQSTICTIGPWVAPLSEAAAEYWTRWEMRRNLPAGSILVIVLEK
ncbi:MAG: class SAM-dependent methyltransferase [Paenibacillus sp.]|jgi:2-polyprenyl-3-methyl-5-hydroxy-6-metoxy-1,4-benzoquinol methylase|nr:class SAM-dependent methyltransferase [Paenibacillus sp.]